MSAPTSQKCPVCGQTITNFGGFAWYHANGLIMCGTNAEIASRGNG